MQIGADAIGDGEHVRVVLLKRVGAGTGNDDLGAEGHGALHDTVVVVKVGGLVQTVCHGLEGDRRGRRMPLIGHEAML